MNIHNLVWMDLEMTGLDPETDRIIEIATIVTDGQLNVIAEAEPIVVHQSDALLEAMDDWNTRTHGQTGLTERVRQSTVTEAQAEAETLAFLKKYVRRGQSPLCGNSICQDRRFIYRYMKALSGHLHYRNVDVSTLKELARRWDPGVLGGFTKKASHKALDDVRESIEELKYFRQHFIKAPPNQADPDHADPKQTK